MKIEHLVQGTPEWDQFRLSHFGASEAAAMLGLSKKVRRSELLRMKHTGIAKAFSDWVRENILDAGHEVEALARPHIEQRIGDDLYPVTCSAGKHSASCDGLTLEGRIAFEHKQWNEVLAAAAAAGHVPDEHMPQCQQILMVTGAEKVLFTVSDGTPERMHVVEVFPDAAWFERLRAGWAQFEVDLQAYVPEAVDEPKPVGRTPENLPALRIEVTGAVTASNLQVYKEHALAVFKGINRELVTDAHFADAEKTVKWCSDVESRLAAAKEHALSQTESIDALFRTIDEISGEARAVRLELDKLVKARKEQIRVEIVTQAQAELDKHVAGLNQRLGATWVPRTLGAFAEAIKGKKTVASVKDAASVVLANTKIATSALADRLDANRKHLRQEEGQDWFFLFADFTAVGGKPAEDFQAIAAQRIAKHKEAEAARLEAERERIREEERAKTEAAAALKRQQEEIEAARQRASTPVAEAATAGKADNPEPGKLEAAQDSPAQATQQVLKAEAATPDATDRDAPASNSPVGGPMGAGQPAAAGPMGELREPPSWFAPALALARACDAGEISEAEMQRGYAAIRDAQAAPGMGTAGLSREALLRDALEFTKYAAAPFFGKFPSHPKTSPEWWAGLRERIDRLQPLLAKALGEA